MISPSDKTEMAYAILRKNNVPCALQIGMAAVGGLHLESVREGPAIDDWCARLYTNDVGAIEGTKTPVERATTLDVVRLVSILPPIARRGAKTFGHAGPLVMNSRVILCSGVTVPDEISAAIRGFELPFVFDLESTHSILWVKDPDYSAWWPYRLDASQAQLIQSTPAENYDEASRALLHAIGFLIAPRGERDKAAPQRGSYWRMDNFINRIQRKALSAYFWNLMMAGLLKKGDFQTAHRYWAHNDAITRFIQLQTLPAVRRLTGIDWEPTFTSFLGYEHPASLSCHTDREQAALTLSLLIDYRVEGRTVDDEWPIFIEHAEPAGAFDMTLIGLGNAIAFQGGHRKHYRDPIPEHHHSLSLCFHYAVPRFQGKRF